MANIKPRQIWSYPQIPILLPSEKLYQNGTTALHRVPEKQQPELFDGWIQQKEIYWRGIKTLKTAVASRWKQDESGHRKHVERNNSK